MRLWLKVRPNIDNGFHLMIQWSGLPHSMDLDMFRKSAYPDFHECPAFMTSAIFHMCVFPRFPDFLDFLVFVTSQVAGFSRICDVIDILFLSVFGSAVVLV